MSGSGLQLEEQQGIGQGGTKQPVPACRVSREAALFTQSIGAAKEDL